MANRKVTDLPEKTVLNANDIVYLVDSEDTTESPQGTSKKTKVSALATMASGVQTVTGSVVDNTDPLNPVVNAASESYANTRADQARDEANDYTDTKTSSTSVIPEGTNLYFTTARVLATLLTGISFVTGGAIVSTDSILVAMGKIQKQITDALASISGKQDTLVSGTNIKTVDGNSLLGSGNLQLPRRFILTANRAINVNNPTWVTSNSSSTNIIGTDSTTNVLTTALSGVGYGNSIGSAPYNCKLVKIIYSGRGASATIVGVVKGDVVQGTGNMTNTVTVFEQSSFVSQANRIISVGTVVLIEEGKNIRFSMRQDVTGPANDMASLTFVFEEVI